MTKSDEQYRQELSEIEYRVTRHAATEPPFTGRYWDHWDEGRYHCVCCGTPLFVSSTKFDAGCGWPSYHTPVNTSVRIMPCVTSRCSLMTSVLNGV